MHDLATLFKALSDETRTLCVALLLSEEELCVCEIENALEVTQSKVSRHLRYLLNAKMVQDWRIGTWIYYKLIENPEPQIKSLFDYISKFQDQKKVKSALSKLKTFRKSERCPLTK